MAPPAKAPLGAPGAESRPDKSGRYTCYTLEG
jgi:hypothetical protein